MSLEEFLDHTRKKTNADLERFNYLASHDLKEPIRNIGNFTGLIFKKLPAQARKELGDYFSIIKNSSKHLYDLLDDLVKYNQIRHFNPVFQEVDMKALISDVWISLEEVVQQNNAKLNVDTLPAINSSQSLLYILFYNLIENGLKYNTSEDPVIRIIYTKQSGMHEFRIIDNGQGIDEAYHKTVFQVFRKLENRRETPGSGIGLAICKTIVQKLKGKIELESQLNQGSTFIVELPE